MAGLFLWCNHRKFVGYKLGSKKENWGIFPPSRRHPPLFFFRQSNLGIPRRKRIRCFQNIHAKYIETTLQTACPPPHFTPNFWIVHTKMYFINIGTRWIWYKFCDCIHWYLHKVFFYILYISHVALDHPLKFWGWIISDFVIWSKVFLARKHPFFARIPWFSWFLCRFNRVWELS